jgi:hypothetical protein
MGADLLEWTIWKTSGSKSWMSIVMSQLGECQTSHCEITASEGHSLPAGGQGKSRQRGSCLSLLTFLH